MSHEVAKLHPNRRYRASLWPDQQSEQLVTWRDGVPYIMGILWPCDVHGKIPTRYQYDDPSSYPRVWIELNDRAVVGLKQAAEKWPLGDHDMVFFPLEGGHGVAPTRANIFTELSRNQPERWGGRAYDILNALEPEGPVVLDSCLGDSFWEDDN